MYPCNRDCRPRTRSTSAQAHNHLQRTTEDRRRSERRPEQAYSAAAHAAAIGCVALGSGAAAASATASNGTELPQADVGHAAGEDSSDRRVSSGSHDAHIRPHLGRDIRDALHGLHAGEVQHRGRRPDDARRDAADQASERFDQAGTAARNLFAITYQVPTLACHDAAERSVALQSARSRPTPRRW